MRKMKVKRFFFGSYSVRDIERFLDDPTITIKKITIAPHDSCDDALYVFYEETSEQLAAEKEELQELDRIAQQLEEDEDYAKLKNATQRELYLLTKYDVPSSRAKKLIELVNLRKILQAEEQE